MSDRARQRTCITCNAYAPDPDDPLIGNCRSGPPQAVVLPGGPNLLGQPQVQTLGVWPPVRPEHWCRQWGERG